MAKENDSGGWTDIDPKAATTLNSVEKVEYNVEGEEPETEESTPEPSVETKEEPEQNYEIVEEEEVKEEPQQEEPQELEGINSKGAEKRIRQLVHQRKEREGQIEQMATELDQLRSELVKNQQTTKSYELSSLSSRENELEERIKMAESSYLRAYDDGEKEELLAAQNMLNDAKTDLKIIKARKAQAEHSQKQEDVDRTKEYKEEQTYQPSATPQQTVDPMAQDWVGRNAWFGKDEVATAVALAVDQKLKAEGYDPNTKEFYNEIDRQVQQELPHKFNRGTVNTKKPSQVVAGSSRKSSPKNKVKLSQRDVELANKWGIPLDRYAAEKNKVDNLNGYTTIETKRA